MNEIIKQSKKQYEIKELSDLCVCGFSLVQSSEYNPVQKESKILYHCTNIACNVYTPKRTTKHETI